MIRVLMVHCEFVPQSSGIARHMDGLAQALTARGDIALSILVQRAEPGALGDVVDDAGFKTLFKRIHGADVVHVHGARTLISTVALRVARLLGKPAVFTPHCYYQGGSWGRRLGKRLWDWGVEASSLRHADAVVLLHSGWRQSLADMGFQPRRIAVIPNCIDARAVQDRLAATPARRLSGAPALLSVGRIDKIKRLDDAIAALGEPGLEQAELHIVGQGDDRGRLQSLVADLGLGARVHFLGWRADTETAAMMRGCDAMILASEREGLPTVFLEALLAGVPMAVSDIDGNRAVADAVGWRHVFPLGDRRALADCARDCAASSVSPTVIDAVWRLFSWQSRADDVVALYSDVLSTRTPLAPEFDALRQGVGLALQPSRDGQALACALAQVTDWQAFVRGAERHRVSPLILAALKILPAGAVAPDTMQALQRRTRRNTLRGLVQVAELMRLMAAFQAKNINFLVLKGAVLSQRLYGDPFRRGIGDMDLLIARADFPSAHALLIESGYVRQDTKAATPPPADLVALAKDWAYAHGDGHVVELHLQLSDGEDIGEWEFHSLWADRTMVRLSGIDLPALPDRVLLPYLVTHGARHRWDRLCWLADIAMLLENDAIRTQALADCARLGWRNEALHADALVRLWLGEGGAHPGRISPKMAWFIQAFFSGRRWLERPRRGTWGWVVLELRHRVWRMWLSNDWHRNLAALKRAWRNPVDEAVIPLPKRLTFLYPLLRPLGWVIRNFVRRDR